MKCRNCGKEIEPGFDYCDNCGTVLSNEERANLKKTKHVDYTFDVPAAKDESEYAEKSNSYEPDVLEIVDENALDEIASREEEAAKEREKEMAQPVEPVEPVSQNGEPGTTDVGENVTEQTENESGNTDEPASDNGDTSDSGEKEKELGVEDEDFFDEFQKEYALKKMFGHPEAKQDELKKKQKQKAAEEKAAKKEKAEKERQEKAKAEADKARAEAEKRKAEAAKKKAEAKLKKDAEAKKKLEEKNKAAADKKEEALRKAESKGGGKSAIIVCVVVALICICVGVYGYNSGWFESFIPVGPAETTSDTQTTAEKTTTEKETSEKVTTEKATTEKVTTEKVTTEKATTEKETTEKITVDTTSYPGYVPPGEEAPVIGENDKTVTLSDSDYLYSAPSEDSYAVYSVYDGQSVEIKGYNSDKTWAFVALSNGYFGWISSKLYK